MSDNKDAQQERELARKVLAHVRRKPEDMEAAWEDLRRDMAANPEAVKLMQWKAR